MFLTKDPGHGRVRSRLLILPFTVLLLVSSQSFSFAGSATWKLNPTSGDWNTAANWTPSTVPNSSTDTATFDVSSRSNLSLSASVKLDGITFDPGASAFSITVSPNFLLTLEGLGIMNNSGATQNFVVANFGTLYFDNSATAGSQTFFINTGGTVGSGGGTIYSLASRARALVSSSTRPAGLAAAEVAAPYNSRAARPQATAPLSSMVARFMAQPRVTSSSAAASAAAEIGQLVMAYSRSTAARSGVRLVAR